MDIEIKHDLELNRFVTVVDGYESVVEYSLKENILDLFRTFTPTELRGKGIAGKLVKFALEHAKSNNLKIIPTCSYVKAYLNKNDDYKELLA